MPLPRYLAVFCLAAALALASGPSLAQARQTEAGVAMFQAQRALVGGRPDLALALADAALARDGSASRAWVIRAVALRDLGRADAARAAATSAWRTANTAAERFDAAFVAGDIAARDGRWTSSQIWLRRADQNAPDARARARVAEAYRGVSARNPLQIELTFVLRPSDNINNGGEFTPGAFNTEEAVAGLEIGAGATLGYRISESPRHRTELYLSTYARRAVLESGFRDVLPDADRNEFDYAALSFGVSHRFAAIEGLGPTGLRLGFGASYYRNGHLSNFGEIGLTQDAPQGETGLWRVGLTLRDETRFDTPAASYRSAALSLDRFGRTAGGNAFSLGATLAGYDSEAPTVEGRNLALRARVDLGRAIRGARPDLALGVSLRDLPAFPLVLFCGCPDTGRTDVTVTATLGLTIERMTFYGFQPRLELTARDVNSSVDTWDSRSLGIGATLVSRF